MKNAKHPTRVPVQSRAIEKKKRILAATFKIVGAKGYANTDTVDIAKAAGISVGTLYAYFRNKREIFLEASSGFYAELRKRLEENIPETMVSTNPAAEVRLVLNSLLSINREYRFFQKEFVALSFSDEEIKKIYQARRMEIVEYLLPRLRKVCGGKKPSRVGLFMCVSFLQDLYYQIDAFPEYGLHRAQALRIAEKAIEAMLLDE